jgi:hypothetical protein
VAGHATAPERPERPDRRGKKETTGFKFAIMTDYGNVCVRYDYGESEGVERESITNGVYVHYDYGGEAGAGADVLDVR